MRQFWNSDTVIRGNLQIFKALKIVLKCRVMPAGGMIDSVNCNSLIYVRPRRFASDELSFLFRLKHGLSPGTKNKLGSFNK